MSARHWLMGFAGSHTGSPANDGSTASALDQVAGRKGRRTLAEAEDGAEA